MKNIHLLPTKEPSRLKKINDTVYLHEDDLFIFDGFRYNHNLYITNDEEIKDGDWFTDDNNSLKRSYKLSHVQFSTPKKIILTTDQDLIKDGIQAIGDDFLEWFVKNPSCGWVEITTFFSGIDYPYEIIIPKKESKPIHEQIIDVVGGEDRFREIAGLKPKKETLVEDTLSKIKLVLSMSNEAQAIRLLEQYGELQAERMYSEEEVLNILQEFKMYLSFGDEVSQAEWFEQFKKK